LTKKAAIFGRNQRYFSGKAWKLKINYLIFLLYQFTSQNKNKDTSKNLLPWLPELFLTAHFSPILNKTANF
jgi:hypothetical protein